MKCEKWSKLKKLCKRALKETNLPRVNQTLKQQRLKFLVTVSTNLHTKKIHPMLDHGMLVSPDWVSGKVTNRWRRRFGSFSWFSLTLCPMGAPRNKDHFQKWSCVDVRWQNKQSNIGNFTFPCCNSLLKASFCKMSVLHKAPFTLVKVTQFKNN